MIYKLPYDVEVVFTNCEEQGGLGAEYYLRHTAKEVIGCIFLNFEMIDKVSSEVETAVNLMAA